MPPTTTTTGSRLKLQLSESKISNIGVQVIYGFGLIIWIIITILLELWPNSSTTSRILLALPVLVCVSNIITPIPGSDIILDPTVEQTSLLTFILISTSIISPWLTSLIDKRRKYHVRIIKTFVVMLILLTLTQYGIFSLRYVSDFETHFDTIINTYALSLLGFCVSEFLHIEYTDKGSEVQVAPQTMAGSIERTILTSGAQLNILNPH